MRVHMIARAIALVCVTSGAVQAAPVTRAECPGCVAAPAMDSSRVAEHWVAMGDALSDAERYREAVAAYQRSIQLDARRARTSAPLVARAYALMGNDKQAVRWLEQSLLSGATPKELWSDELFARYRDEPRLRVMLEHQVDLRGRKRGARSSVSA
jgi:tetratricopeptide (TPR) repeat protein